MDPEDHLINQREKKIVKGNGIFIFLEDALTWLDGSTLDYTNWRLKAPDASVMHADTCVSTRVSDAEWLLADCSNRLGFVCKTRSGTFQYFTNLGVTLIHIMTIRLFLSTLDNYKCRTGKLPYTDYTF